MKTLSLLVIVTSLLISILLAFVLAVSNPEQLTLLIGFSEIGMTSGQLLIFAFSSGATIGVAGMLLFFLSGQFKVGFLQSKLNKLQSELDSIKTNGIHEKV